MTISLRLASRPSVIVRCRWLVSGALALLAACGGNDGGSPPSPAEPEGQKAALSASQPGELTAFIQRKLRERAASRNASAAGGAYGAGLTDSSPTAMPVAAGAAAPPAYSGTLTQERGVDEPDLLKTDGTQIYALDLSTAAPLLRAYRRAADGRLGALGTVALNAGDAQSLAVDGMLLSERADALVALSVRWSGFGGANPCVDICPAVLLPPGPIWMRGSVALERFDLGDPSRIVSTARLEIDGQLVASRRVGDSLIVVSTYRPMFAADQLPATASGTEREAAIASTRGADALPRLRIDGGAAAPMLAETDCWVQEANASLAIEITTVSVFDLRSASLAQRSRCFVGGSEAITMTPNSLYLASTRMAYAVSAVLRYPPTIETDIHKFAFEAGGLSYRGSGTVAGHLGWDPERKPLRLSEHEGDLRVLTFTGSFGWASVPDPATAPSPATLSILRERSGGGALQVLATLPNTRRPQALGKPGEQVHGVRLAGPRGYVVTFRQIDPLYVLDLSDPADPRIAGELEAPGFSDHLVPLSPALLLGVGKEVTPAGRVGGVKVALFDVADPARPRELDMRVFGAAGSASALDYSRHGLDLLLGGTRARAGIPLLLYDANYTNLRTGLQRLEIDLAAGTLSTPALLDPSGDIAKADLGAQRSVQIGAQIYYLRGGQLSGYDW